MRTKTKTSLYLKGKRWGYAVASKQLGASKSNISKVDKAMQTSARNARSGTKKLSQDERTAYRGIADGMYDAIKLSEKASSSKKNSSGTKKKTRKKKLFQYNYQTRVPGSYTVDGKFEPF